MLVIVLARSPGLAAAGLLLVGISLSPVVPTALSVAGRSDPARAGAAVSLVTAVGYGAFVLGPPFTGALADATSLRIGARAGDRLDRAARAHGAAALT